MKKFVLVFAGGMGSGKSELTKALSSRLGWPRASFGDHIRKLARESSLDDTDRAVLQRLGQALVLTQPEQFVNDVIAGTNSANSIILDGLRHVEILLCLKARTDLTLRMVYIKTPAEVRQSRVVEREHVDRRVVASYDADITEAQISRIIPQYAHKTIDGTLPISILASDVENFVRQEMSAVAA
ncbi:AAA family ATPase [Agrobacterium pusense]|uniref:AAA family ATPase n=1 Tax=Agrobacterium pusense TaxID=648995 RepID=UPI003D0A2082